ncbi:MAG: hypothetical protein ACPLTR_00530 [Thermacetogeniaceae bacterium]
MKGRDDSGLVHLITVYPPEDIFVEGVLQSAGIPVVKRRESIAPVEGITLGPLAEVHIYVPLGLEVKAREVLAEVRSDI